MGDRDLVRTEEVWLAVRALEAEQAAGTIGRAEAARRIDRCRRAVTPRDLWKASGGRVGSPAGLGGPRRRGAVLDSLIDALTALWPRR